MNVKLNLSDFYFSRTFIQTVVDSYRQGSLKQSRRIV